MRIEGTLSHKCEHHPYPSPSKWKAFLAFLFHKNYYYYRFDSSAICKKCHVHIRTPKLYRSPLLLLIYCIVGSLISVFLFWPCIYRNGVSLPMGTALLTLFAFDRVFVALLFTFAKWPADEQMGNCSGRDAIWGKRRLIIGWGSIYGTLLILLNLATVL